MKKSLFFMMFALLLAVFTSCTENDYTFVGYPYYVPTYIVPGTSNAQGQSAIAFTGYTNGNVTRAYHNSVSNLGYDDFTLYVWTADSVVMDGWHTQWVSPGWTYVGVDNQQVKYFDNFVDSYNFIGIIPQTNVQMSNGGVTIPVEGFTVDDEANVDTPKEFLFATTNVAKAQYPQGASMNFVHGNAKIYLKFTSDDADTEIIDYYPGTQGYNVYTMTTTTVPVLGPSLADIAIADDDIDYINSHYTSTKGFSNYQTSNVIEGDLNTNMWDYLLQKYPALASVNLGNWGTYVSGQNMRLVHLEKMNGSNSYDGVFVNVQNVNWSSYTVSGSQGVENILMIPATSVIGDGSDAVLATYPTEADVTVSMNGLSWNVTSTDDKVVWTKPAVKITSNDTSSPIASPTTWYTLPCNSNDVGYTIKFSYNYKGVNVYDTRVFLPASECAWENGKYYTYIIQINGRGNGHSDPNNIDGNDPVIPADPSNNEIKVFSVTFSEYGNGGTVIKQIK